MRRWCGALQYLTPLFEFSGACAGCGETPYLRLLTQLFGDRLLVANATGCSSIYGGNLPTTPWSVNKQGRGPAWANSLFEDNAEFGLGFRLSLDKQREEAERLLAGLAPQLGPARVRELLDAPQVTQADVDAQRGRVAALEDILQSLADPAAHRLRTIAKHLVRKSVWIVGGDGWAYDIGYGGLDHVLASGRNVNILVLDTEVYSNTGGQASKATPRGGVAKFAAGGKQGRKKDLGLMAVAYGNVYVAQIAMGASAQQTMDAFLEAEAHDGPSLIIAYSHCIAHGINMRFGMRQQKLAVECGHWPLYRFKPPRPGRERQEFVLDSLAPSIPLKAYAYNEIRYKMLSYTNPSEAKRLLGLAQEDVDQRWRVYSSLADRWPATARRGQGEAGSHVPAPAATAVKAIDEAISSRRHTMDMTTRYMGLTLKNPLVASASPLSESLDGIRRLEDNGAAAVVMFSLFEEQIRHDSAALEHFFTRRPRQLRRSAVVLSRDPGLRRRSRSVPGSDPQSHRRRRHSDHREPERRHRARLGELRERDAGCRRQRYRVECLLHSRRDVSNPEPRWSSSTSTSCQRSRPPCSIPVAIKVGPYFSSFADMASQLDEAGADALVLFNRFYQPDFDIETRTVVPSLTLSRPDEIRLPLLWISLLYGRVSASLAATTGVHSAVEAIKYLMAGADVVMSTAALLQQGPPFFARLLADMTDWMEKKGYDLRRPDARLDEPAVGHGLERVRARELHQGPRKLHEDHGPKPYRRAIEAGAEVIGP